MNILIDESFFNPELLKRFKDHFPNARLISHPDAYAKVDILIASPKMVIKDILDQMPNLVMIKLLTAGYDSLDLDEIKSRGIEITYAKDVYSIQIAEDVFSKILYFNRHLGEFHEQSKNHEWRFVPSRYEINGKTVGILGAGSIGDEIAKRMKAFGAKVIGYKRQKLEHHSYDDMYYGKEGFNDLLSQADYVIVCLSLNHDTYHLLNEDAFNRMKKDALIVNIARGDIIDQHALIHALNHEKIRGAALDVTTPEPLPKDDPLWQAKHILITPHQASSSPKMKERLMDEVIDTLMRYTQGLPLINRIP